MYRKANNTVIIEGILAETDIKYGSFTARDGKPKESIGGSIKILVETPEGDLLIPVYMFTTKITKNNTVSPAYESIERVMKEFVSIASSGNKELADKVRITGGELKTNEFVGQNGKIVSHPRIYTNFVNKVTGEFEPKAKFDLEFMVSKIGRAVDKEGVELDPPRLELDVIVPQYTAENAPALKVDVMKLIATSPNVIDGIESNWFAGECHRGVGRLNFTSRTEEVVEEMGIGEAQSRTRTVSVNEIILTGGVPEPLDGDAAWSLDEITAGMELRDQKLEDMKSGKKSTAKTPPVQADLSTKGKKDLGF